MLTTTPRGGKVVYLTLLQEAINKRKKENGKKLKSHIWINVNYIYNNLYGLYSLILKERNLVTRRCHDREAIVTCYILYPLLSKQTAASNNRGHSWGERKISTHVSTQKPHYSLFFILYSLSYSICSLEFSNFYFFFGFQNICSHAWSMLDFVFLFIYL